MTPDQIESEVKMVIEALKVQAERLSYHTLPVPNSTLAEWLKLQAEHLSRVVA